MRKCTARAWENPKGEFYHGRWVDVTGVFHLFGVSYEEFENGGCPYTTAIVEDNDGQVWVCDARSLKFLKEVGGGK